MKRLFYLLLICFPLLLCNSVCGETWEGFEYTVQDSGIILESYNGEETEVSIPYTFDNYYVVEIADHAFEGNQFITSVSMPSTINRIGKRSFADCINLEVINFSNGLTEIGEEAFSNCKQLSSISLPANLQAIGRRAFSGCRNISYIYDLTGYYSMEVGSGAFDDTYWFRVNKSDYITLSQGYVLLKYQGTDSNPDLPWYLISIAEDAFAGNDSITTLRLPNYVRFLSEGSISEMSSLESVYGGEEIASVDTAAFRNLPLLETVEIPNVKLTKQNFLDCPMVSYGSISSVKYDPDADDEADRFFLSEYSEELDGIILLHCLKDADFEQGNVVIPDFIRNKPVIIIGEGACQNRNDITKVTLPRYLEGIESWAFSYDENLKEVVFPEGIKWIMSDAFTNSAISTDVPELSDVEIDSRAFYRSEKQ